MTVQKMIDWLREGGTRFPIPWNEALKYRGIGPQMRNELANRGIVLPSAEHYQMSDLSTRAFNVLERLKLYDKQSARRAIEMGLLHPDSKVPNAIRHYGWKTHKEVCLWAGLPEPEKPKKGIVCPHCGKQFYRT